MHMETGYKNTARSKIRKGYKNLKVWGFWDFAETIWKLQFEKKVRSLKSIRFITKSLSNASEQYILSALSYNSKNQSQLL